MGIIESNHVRKWGKKQISNKLMSERMMIIDVNNSEKEGERVLIKKTWEMYSCDGKITLS